MSDTYSQRANLSVSSTLAALIEDQALPGTGINADQFWEALSALVSRLAPQNAALLAERLRLKEQIDAWHKERRGQPHDAAAYKAFLEEIGYLKPVGEDFRIGTENVDAEIAITAGPQLVVPVSNARYALNAANARWGSL